ncbi:hypothetical protein E2C01_024469 [Portunus trituberculatus]|uniref:Uncharacterized protein n=1 Tax=Portunus trituberculatus TaxID=210409 RepID=A0A5B7ECX4_PORTR|nr:hypothetical protein [Portunus trituberculatus]
MILTRPASQPASQPTSQSARHLTNIWWGMVEWCRGEAQVLQEEVQRLCGSSFFRRCGALPDPSPPAWIGLPGVYPVWDLVRRRQQLEWVLGNSEYMSPMDWFLRGVAGSLFALLFIHLHRLIRIVRIVVKDILRERTLDRISSLRRPSFGLHYLP